MQYIGHYVCSGIELDEITNSGSLFQLLITRWLKKLDLHCRPFLHDGFTNLHELACLVDKYELFSKNLWYGTLVRLFMILKVSIRSPRNRLADKLSIPSR